MEAVPRLIEQDADAALDRVELLARGETVGRRLLNPRRHLTAQSRNAHHVELIQVRAEDREEFHPLEQRVAFVERLGEHAPVELEPTRVRGSGKSAGEAGAEGFME